ncbi:MAG: hypothetical protein ACE5JA_10825 [bacterium]
MKIASGILLISLLFFLIPMLSSCSKSENGGGGGGGPVFPWDYFPGDNEISGWVKDGPAETATTTQELWDLIDGEGQVYMDHGFSSCGRQVYRGSLSGSDVEIRYLYIYDQDTDSNAAAVYDDPRSGTGTPWLDDPAGTEARIDDTGLDSYTIDFYQSKYFVKITILRKTTEALDVAKLFCHNVSDKMPSGPTTRLPLQG